LIAAAAVLSTTLENEAIATFENEATQTDWVGDLGGELGIDPAAGRGRCSAAAGRQAIGCRVCCQRLPAADSSGDSNDSKPRLPGTVITGRPIPGCTHHSLV
jgi:hypothetical protein